ncbi:MAG: hypothetical protein H7123_08145 [Thermoleophilia bacterium]|nr:hypothetical protein [Thermoleophilia bacterium]
MPWFPESSSLLFPADSSPAQLPFFEGLLELDADELSSSFAGEPKLDDPRHHPVRDVNSFADWVRKTQLWLSAEQVHAWPVDIVEHDGRVVEEVVLKLVRDGSPIELPVAIASDLDDTGRLVAVRLYHSLWPLTGGHEVRAPLLKVSPDAKLPDDAVGDYQRALAAGSVDGVLAVFEENATVREPAGGAYSYHGTNELRHIYTSMFTDGAGIPLEHCQLTDDGRACAIEYNIRKWGHHSIPPQAGLAVYVRGATGRLVSARIYDDVDPPTASDSSHSV